jgi:hypothetical protein
MVARHVNWSRRLGDFLKSRRNMPFEWGTNDCLAFAGAAVHAITGDDYFAEYKGYTDEEGAKALLEKHGGVKGIISRHLGAGLGNYRLAKRGDIVMVRIPHDTAGVVDDSGQRILVVTPTGTVALPISKAVRVWSY